uniref:Uncharacterized protein n=1 Tax=Oryza nivara TaxID=4536 RepID=A0A0E0HBY5_ORYNI
MAAARPRKLAIVGGRTDEGNGGGGPRCCSSSSSSRLPARSPTARESLDHISVNCIGVGGMSGCRSVHSRHSTPTRRVRLLVPAQPRLFLDSPDWRRSAAGRE